MPSNLDDLHVVNALRDPGLGTFYASPGMNPAAGMMVRGYTIGAGRKPPGAIY